MTDSTAFLLSSHFQNSEDGRARTRHQRQTGRPRADPATVLLQPEQRDHNGIISRDERRFRIRRLQGQSGKAFGNGKILINLGLSCCIS